MISFFSIPDATGIFHWLEYRLQTFIVRTARFDVRVLGTCFDVKAYSSDEVVSVDVESGKVQVDLPEAMMRLQAKEQVSINTLSGEYSKRRDERDVAVWRKGGLRFSSTPVRDVAKELERMYNCRITFAEGQEFNNLISGEHENKSLEAVLQSMEYTSVIRYRKEGVIRDTWFTRVETNEYLFALRDRGFSVRQLLFFLEETLSGCFHILYSLLIKG